jgi:hypothetical protein
LWVCHFQLPRNKWHHTPLSQYMIPCKL